MLNASLLIIVAVCALGFGACAVVLMQRHSSRGDTEATSELRLRVAELTEQVQMGEVVMQNQARRLERLGWELSQLKDVRRAPVAPPAPVVTESSERINQAIKLARRGESVESLMSLCALGRGEAELLVKLHYRAQPAASSDAA